MLELLAVPTWNAPRRTLDDWIATLAAQGVAPVVTREPDGETWIEVASLRLRGYVVEERDHLDAINFELHADDVAPAMRLVESAATAVDWETHVDEDAESEEE